MEITLVDLNRIICFWLCFSRWLSSLMLLPLFGEMELPGIIKVLATLVITFAFFPMTSPSVMQDLMVVGDRNFWFLTVVYTLMGLSIGLLAKLIFSIFVSSGMVITQMMGLSAIRYFDPNTALTIGPIEKLIHLSMVSLLLGSGVMLPLMKGVLLSFDHLSLVNIQNFYLQPDGVLFFVKKIFESTLVLSTPLMVIHFVINVVLGLVTRLVPQINVLMVSFAINILLGILVFCLTSEEFFITAEKIYQELIMWWYRYVT